MTLACARIARQLGDTLIGDNELVANQNHDDGFKTRLIGLVRALTQGAGLTAEAVGREEGTTLFEDMTEKDVVHLVSWAADQMADTPFANAIRNALGIGEFSGSTLTERRDHFMKSRGMSPRTLVRHEQSGAEMLVDLMVTASQGTEISKSSSKIFRLEQSIEDIQIVLATLIDADTVEKVVGADGHRQEAIESAKRRLLSHGSNALMRSLLLTLQPADVSLDFDLFQDKQAYREYLEEDGIKPSTESESSQD